MAASMGSLLVIVALLALAGAQEATSRGSCDALFGDQCPELDTGGPSGFSSMTTPALRATEASVDDGAAVTATPTPTSAAASSPVTATVSPPLATTVQLQPSAVAIALEALRAASTIVAHAWGMADRLKTDKQIPLLLRPRTTSPATATEDADEEATTTEETTAPTTPTTPEADVTTTPPGETLDLSLRVKEGRVEIGSPASGDRQNGMAECYSTFELVEDTCPDLSTDQEISTADIVGQWIILFGYSRTTNTQPFCANVSLEKHPHCPRTVTLEWFVSGQSCPNRPLNAGVLFASAPGFLTEPQPGTMVVKLLYRRGRFLLLAVCDQSRKQAPRVLALGRDLDAASDAAGDDMRAMMALWRTLHARGVDGPSWYICKLAYDALPGGDTVMVLTGINIGPRPDGRRVELPFNPDGHQIEP